MRVGVTFQWELLDCFYLRTTAPRHKSLREFSAFLTRRLLLTSARLHWRLSNFTLGVEPMELVGSFKAWIQPKQCAQRRVDRLGPVVCNENRLEKLGVAVSPADTTTQPRLASSLEHSSKAISVAVQSHSQVVRVVCLRRAAGTPCWCKVGRRSGRRSQLLLLRKRQRNVKRE